MAGINPHHILAQEVGFSQGNSFYPQPGRKQTLLSSLWANIEFSGFPFHSSSPPFLGPMSHVLFLLGHEDYRPSKPLVQHPLGPLVAGCKLVALFTDSWGFPFLSLLWAVHLFINWFRLWLHFIHHFSEFVEEKGSLLPLYQDLTQSLHFFSTFSESYYLSLLD